jgi:hypothetical protein
MLARGNAVDAIVAIGVRHRASRYALDDDIGVGQRAVVDAVQDEALDRCEATRRGGSGDRRLGAKLVRRRTD